MTFAVEQDESPDPSHIRLLSPTAIMTTPNRFTHLLQQLGLAYSTTVHDDAPLLGYLLPVRTTYVTRRSERRRLHTYHQTGHTCPSDPSLEPERTSIRFSTPQLLAATQPPGPSISSPPQGHRTVIPTAFGSYTDWTEKIRNPVSNVNSLLQPPVPSTHYVPEGDPRVSPKDNLDGNRAR